IETIRKVASSGFVRRNLYVVDGGVQTEERVVEVKSTGTDGPSQGHETTASAATTAAPSAPQSNA
ncbi:MAG TPA: hypothetical protein DCM48_01750, partial [Thalassospira sp.]|nr:hypothetical protein [Thalassospira sp.]